MGNGLRGCLRGLHTMAAVARTRHDACVRPAGDVPALPRPRVPAQKVAEGRMLPFDATMELLTGAGIPVAPWHLVDEGGPVPPPFEGPYVVKLADVAHRTELGAVRVGVQAGQLEPAVRELRDLAQAHGLPARVAVQPLLPGHGEAFVGINADSELGPVVAFGLGGVFVEIMKRVAGRMAPMSETDAGELLAEFDDTGVLDGYRGAPAWDRRSLVATLVAASRLAAGGRDWIESIDINPLIVGPTGVTAVDGLCLVRED
ncbi:hypothetical protein CJD44_00955 [Streptomyces sp. alain-838]|nr:acetate--CoA ligase family protein [Streptomyces sp. alain-838]PAK28043.1 hypothetical protein CJD44_00955 [Streptomyces sp. alain-838]